MPTILYASTIREAHEGFTFSIKANHTLIADEPSRDAVQVKGRFPNIDIVSRGDVVLAVAGHSNGRDVPASVVVRSAPLNHFHSYLKTNARGLGISTVSDAYIDEDDNLVKVSLSPSNPYETEGGYPRVYLVSISLTFIYRATDGEGPEVNDIFSERSFLPLATALDSVLERFISTHFARRYPLIFGPMRLKLQAERTYFPHISRSISGVVARTSDPRFKSDAIALLGRLNRKLCREAKHIGDAYKHHIGTGDEQNTDLFGRHNNMEISQEDSLSQGLSRVLRAHVRSPRFKGCCADRLNPIKCDILDEFSLGNTYNEQHLSVNDQDPSLTIRWEDLPLGRWPEDSSVPDTVVDGAEDSMSLDYTQDVEYDSADEWDLDSTAFTTFNDNDNDRLLDDDDLEPSERSLTSGMAISLDNFYEDMDDPDYLLDNIGADEQYSDPVWSTDSSQTDSIETPSNSQDGCFTIDIPEEPAALLWHDDLPSFGSGRPTLPSEPTQGHIYLVDSDDEQGYNEKTLNTPHTLPYDKFMEIQDDFFDVYGNTSSDADRMYLMDDNEPLQMSDAGDEMY